MITQLEKYGPINSIVLSRSAESDNVYLQDEESIQANGLCELKIADNQIMNWNDRSDYLPEILAELDGLEYYINDFVSTGIAYLDLCDRYNVKIGDNTYSCVMLNDELEVTQGLVENIHTDMPEETETDYTKADKTDRKINNVSIIVDKQQNQIELLANKIVDISAQASGHKEVELENCSATPLYKLKITGDDSLLFPGDKKKYFTYETYEGSSIDVDIKGSSYDINNLEVKGRSTQEVRSGKNLLPSDLNTKTENGITITKRNDGTYLVNGTATADVSIAICNDFIPMSGTWRMVGCPSGGSSSTYMLSAYVGYWGAGSPNIDTGSGTNITYTGNVKVRFYIKNGTTCNNLLFKPMITYDKTATYNDYEQYGVSPSPDYPSEIKSIDNVQFTISGKNLFIPLGSKTVSGITVVENNDGTYNISGTATSNIEYTNFISLDNSKIINGETYILSSNKDLQAGLTARIEMYNDTNWLRVFVPSIGAINKTQTGVANTANATRVRFGMFISSGTTLDIKNIGFQLEKGSVVTPFEKYKAQTLNIDLKGNELCSTGDTKDILDISVTGDTEINKKIGKRIFNGTESWTLQSINSHDIANFQITLDDYVGGSNILAMCDRFSPQTTLIADTTNEGFHLNASKILFIRIKKSRCSTVEEFKTWLSTHNVTLYYVLKTPETINLSPTKPLYLYDGINHLTNDNNADMVAKMVKSTMFLKTSDLYINQGQSNEKKYDLKIPALRELNGVKDEYLLEDGKATLTKKIGLNADLQKYVLDEPVVVDLGNINVELNEGTNTLTMPSFPNNYYEVTYLLKNEYTNTFATQAEVTNQIKVASDEILIESKTQILENGDELIASINTQSTGNVLINASKLAEINADKINFNSYDFNVTTENMKISIGVGDDKTDIINSSGVLTNLVYNGYTRGNMITGTGDYIPLGRVGGGDTKDTQRNEMIFSFKLPQNFTIQSAKIYLSHAPIVWNISGTSITGYSRNLELYKGQNIEKLKINYDVVNSIINTGGVTTDKIYDVLGTNGFSGNATTTVSTKSAELKDYIDVDKDNYFIIKDSNETAYTTNNDIFGRTGGVFGYLEIIGYSQV